MGASSRLDGQGLYYACFNYMLSNSDLKFICLGFLDTYCNIITQNHYTETEAQQYVSVKK